MIINTHPVIVFSYNQLMTFGEIFVDVLGVIGFGVDIAG